MRTEHSLQNVLKNHAGKVRVIHDEISEHQYIHLRFVSNYGNCQLNIEGDTIVLERFVVFSAKSVSCVRNFKNVQEH